MTTKISDHRLTFELCSRSNTLKNCHKTRNANSFIFHEGCSYLARRNGVHMIKKNSDLKFDLVVKGQTYSNIDSMAQFVRIVTLTVLLGVFIVDTMFV